MGRKRYHRRAILAGLAVGLAGCSGQATDRTTSASRTATETGTTTTSRTTDAPEEGSTTEEPVAVREWPDPYYQGPMVSAHEHMSGPDGYSVARDDLPGFVEWMNRNRVAQVMAIAGDPHMDAVAAHDDRLVPFAFGYNSLRNHFDDLAGAFRDRFAQYPAYDGIGEISLQGQLTPDGDPPTPVDHPELMAVYEFAAAEDVPVMLHTVAPWRYEGGDGEWATPGEYPPFQQLDRAMAAHRETDFLIHESYEWSGMPDGELVAEKLAQHPNLYYDISATAPKLLYGEGAFTRSEFDAEVRVEEEIDRLYSKYGAILEEHSERVLWGMDAGMEWHYEDWALNTFLDIARGILGRLPKENARNVAYQTAEALFDIDVPDLE